MAVSGNDPGGVSWEERRKGLPPLRPEGPDQAIWMERYTSQRQTYNLPEVSWSSTNAGLAADYAQDRLTGSWGLEKMNLPDALDFGPARIGLGLARYRSPCRTGSASSGCWTR